MTMSRQHYVLIADTIKRLDVDENTRSSVAHEFARELETTNSKFDYSRFISACGVTQ